MDSLTTYPRSASRSCSPYRGNGENGLIASAKKAEKEKNGENGFNAKRGVLKPTTPKTGFFSGAKGGKHGKLHTMRL